MANRDRTKMRYFRYARGTMCARGYRSMSNRRAGFLSGLAGLLLTLASCGGEARSAGRAEQTTVESAGAAGAAVADEAPRCGDDIPVVDASCADEGLRCGPYLEHLECAAGEVPFNSFRVCVNQRWTRVEELHSSCYL
jgi:hypothetical protein